MKIMIRLACLLLHTSLVYGSMPPTDGILPADKDRAAKIAANRKSVEKRVGKSVALIKAMTKKLNFLSPARLKEIFVDLSPSEIKVINEKRTNGAAVGARCPLSAIIGFAPFPPIRDTFGHNSPHYVMAKNKGKYAFESTKRFDIGTPVLAPHNGNNCYGVIIHEDIKADGPLNTATYEYRVQVGEYTDETSDDELLRFATPALAPELIGFKKPVVVQKPNENPNSLQNTAASPQLTMLQMEVSAAIAAAIDKAQSGSLVSQSTTNGGLKSIAEEASDSKKSAAPTGASSATATTASLPATPPFLRQSSFKPKLIKHERFDHSKMGGSGRGLVRKPSVPGNINTVKGNLTNAKSNGAPNTIAE